jgi:hypothetical protein
MLIQVDGDPAQQVGRVVPLPQCHCRMGVFVRDHGEDQHGEQEYKLAELFQVTILAFEGAER